MAQCGEDFGKNNHWRTALELLVDILNDPVTPLHSRIIHRERISRALSYRIQLRKLQSDHPEVLKIPIPKPIFIIGFPRTGSTLLYNLMSQDPNSKSPFGWEMAMPFPPPERETFYTDPRIAKVTRRWQIAQRILPPRFKKIHFLNLYGPEEDLELFLKMFLDHVILFARYDTHDYQKWILGNHVVQLDCDATAENHGEFANISMFYAELREWLQVLSFRNPIPPGGHWLLKCPGHTWFLQALFGEFPDAHIVWTHRDVCSVVASLGSLMHTLAYLYRDQIDLDAFGENLLDLIVDGIQKIIRYRDTLDSNKQQLIADIQYSELISDPIGVVRNIYQRFGYPYSTEFEERMRSWLKANPQGKHGQHDYTLENYGLKKEQVEERLGEYCHRFIITPKAGDEKHRHNAREKERLSNNRGDNRVGSKKE